MNDIADQIFSTDAYRVYVFKTGRWKQNSYVVQNLENLELIIVDPGGEAARIINLVDELGGKVSYICLTHAHHDHVGALKAICEHFHSNFYLHPNDFKLLKRAPLFAISFESRKMEIPTLGQIFLSTEQKGSISETIKFYHTPGHTTGGVVLSIGNISFTGDTLLNKMVGRTDLPGASTHELDASISYFLNELPDESTLYPGHGEPWKLSEAKEWWKENRHNLPEYRTEDEPSY